MAIADVTRPKIVCVRCISTGYSVSPFITFTGYLYTGVMLRFPPLRAVAAGLARVVIFESQLSGRYRYLPLIYLWSLSHTYSQTPTRFRKALVRLPNRTPSQK